MLKTSRYRSHCFICHMFSFIKQWWFSSTTSSLRLTTPKSFWLSKLLWLMSCREIKENTKHNKAKQKKKRKTWALCVGIGLQENAKVKRDHSQSDIFCWMRTHYVSFFLSFFFDFDQCLQRSFLFCLYVLSVYLYFSDSTSFSFRRKIIYPAS